MKKSLILFTYFIFIFSCNRNETKNMDFIELSNGLSVPCESLTKIQFDSLRAMSLEKEPIRDLLDDYNIEVYKLKNKHIIVQENDYYTKYYSLDDLQKVLSDAIGSPSGIEILLNKNRFGKSFPGNVSKLKEELLQDLKIDTQVSDVNLLKILDIKINELPDNVKFRKKYLLHFIAVVGEILVNKYNAEWEMILSSDGITWNPYLKLNGQNIQFFSYLYEDIYIDNKPSSLVETYETVNDIIKYNIQSKR